MNGKQKGFTLIEILVVVTIIGVLAGLVVVLIPKSQEKAQIIECTNNQRNFAGLLAAADPEAWRRSGANLILQFVRKGDINDESLKTLFCPGDLVENLEKAGGPEAYKNLDMKSHDHDGLTSYAGRDQDNASCVAKPGQGRTIVTCDDSEDHHNKKGFVCGYSDGSAEFKDKDTAWNMDIGTEVRIGEGSPVKDLQCLRAE
jgi:prepilin-type N-terminal cleavage/methylation domain-containing protein